MTFNFKNMYTNQPPLEINMLISISLIIGILITFFAFIFFFSGFLRMMFDGVFSEPQIDKNRKNIAVAITMFGSIITGGMTYFSFILLGSLSSFPIITSYAYSKVDYIVEAFRTNAFLAFFYSIPFIISFSISVLLLLIILDDVGLFAKEPNLDKPQERSAFAVVVCYIALAFVFMPAMFFTYPEMKRFDFTPEYISKLEPRVLEKSQKTLGFNMFQNLSLEKEVLQSIPKEKDISLTRFRSEIKNSLDTCMSQHTNIAQTYKITKISGLEKKIEELQTECETLTKKHILDPKTLESMYM